MKSDEKPRKGRMSGAVGFIWRSVMPSRFARFSRAWGSRGGCEGGIWELILSSVDDVRDYALALERCQNIKRREEAI